MTKSILLVAAASEMEFSGWLNQAAGTVSHQKAYVVPLHLATIAGLTPEPWRVQIWDEAVQGPATDNLDAGYGLVGITAYSGELDRAAAIADAFRARGTLVVAGGAGVTSEPERLRAHADVLVIGEAELTWPRFLAEFAAGTHRPLYQADGPVDLALSPPPRWDSVGPLLAASYKSGAVQTNRGCPHACEFCDVWLKFGRTIRTKPVAQVCAEVAALERLGMKRVIFSTDNFIGHLRHAKEVLRALVPLNASFRHPLAFTAEVTVDAARDAELLRLMGEANFNQLFIGVESTNLDSLNEVRKRQNTKGDLAEQCRTIASYGMPILGSMIVGFDHDTPAVFDQHFAFLQESCIPIPRLNVLKAMGGTDLYRRLRREGRVIDLKRTYPTQMDEQTMRSNVVFRGMSRVEMYEGYRGLLRRAWDWANFRDRVVGFVDNLTNMPDRAPDPRLTEVAENLRPVMHGIAEADTAIIDEIYAHTARHAPSLLWTIATLVMTQCYQAARLPDSLRVLAGQIRQEHEVEARGGPIMLPPLPEEIPA